MEDWNAPEKADRLRWTATGHDLIDLATDAAVRQRRRDQSWTVGDRSRLQCAIFDIDTTTVVDVVFRNHSDVRRRSCGSLAIDRDCAVGAALRVCAGSVVACLMHGSSTGSVPWRKVACDPS